MFRRALPMFRRTLPMFRRTLPAFRRTLPTFRRTLPTFRRTLPAFRRTLPAFRRTLPAFRRTPPAFRRTPPEVWDGCPEARKKRGRYGVVTRKNRAGSGALLVSRTTRLLGAAGTVARLNHPPVASEVRYCTE